MCSTDVWPEMRETERAMMTVISGWSPAVMSEYLAGLGERLGRVWILQFIEVMDSVVM